MSDSDLALEVSRWLSRILGEDVNPQATEVDLFEAHGADSMDIVDIVETLESRYGIHVPNGDVPNVRTFADVLALAARSRSGERSLESAAPDLLAQLDPTDFLLLAPAGAHGLDRFGEVVVDPAAYRSLLAAAATLRKTDGAASDSIEPVADGRPFDERDLQSWHILAADPQRRRIRGAIRMRVYDLRSAALTPDDLFAFSDVRIADAGHRRLVAAALTQWIERHRDECGFLHQQGGFVVAESFRGSPLAPVLALSVNAWFERIGLRGGLTFATQVKNVSTLDSRLGAYAFSVDDEPLPTFYCDGHSAEGRLLAIEPHRYEERFEPTVEALRRVFADVPIYVNAS